MERIQELFTAYYTSRISIREMAELVPLISAASPEALADLIQQNSEGLQPLDSMEPGRVEGMITNILMQEAPVIKMRSWRKWAAAAVILFVCGLGYRVYNSQRAAVAVQPAIADIKAPTTNRATITLSDGSKVFLDSAANGRVAQQGGVTLVKAADGAVTYSGTSAGIAYNTLANPRGSKPITLTLADGSQVWLNAASSLTYPVAFTGKERKVSISGEGYFEVAHNSSMPFIVSKGDMDVTVLGTHFDVSAYDDENDIKITLLQGSVKVSSLADSKMIRPGEQAILSTVNHQLSTINDIDLDFVMAWKSGRFELDNTPLQAIMRQLGRWYDIQVRFQGTPANLKFDGGISRELPLSGVLKLLEAGGARFEWEGNILMVK